jgi:hypothetical protein
MAHTYNPSYLGGWYCDSQSYNWDGYWGSIYSVDTLDRGMVCVQGGVEQDGKKFHYATQNSEQFKIFELFISGIFHLVSLDHSWLGNETSENKTVTRGGLLYIVGPLYLWFHI